MTVAGRYIAEIAEVGDGVRLKPTADSTVPTDPTEVNLLGLAIALAMGAAGYEHHPEPRDPEVQTIDALLAGDATMPWQPSQPGGKAQVVCEKPDDAPWRCRIHR